MNSLSIEWKIALMAGLVMLLVAKRLVSYKSQFKNLNLILTLGLIISMLAIISFDFINHEFYPGLIAVGLGTVAFTKVMYDILSSPKEDQTTEEEEF